MRKYRLEGSSKYIFSLRIASTIIFAASLLSMMGRKDGHLNKKGKYRNYTSIIIASFSYLGGQSYRDNLLCLTSSKHGCVDQVRTYYSSFDPLLLEDKHL